MTFPWTNAQEHPAHPQLVDHVWSRPASATCPNGVCQRKPTGAASDTYGQEAVGPTAVAYFAQG